MLGRRGRFLEEKRLTAIVFTRASEQDAWRIAGGGCCVSSRLMPMTSRGSHFSFFGMFVTHRQNLPCLCRPPAGRGLSRGCGIGPVTTGLQDKTGMDATPDVDLGRIQFIDRFSLNACAAVQQCQQQPSRRGLRRPLVLMWTGHLLPRSGVSACLPIRVVHSGWVSLTTG